MATPALVVYVLRVPCREAEDSSDERLQQLGSSSMFSRNRVEPPGSAVVIRDGSLRQRGGGAAHVEIEESLLQPDQEAPVRGDSMSLFATLVPPPLRKSKKNFTSGKPATSGDEALCVWRWTEKRGLGGGW